MQPLLSARSVLQNGAGNRKTPRRSMLSKLTAALTNEENDDDLERFIEEGLLNSEEVAAAGIVRRSGQHAPVNISAVSLIVESLLETTNMAVEAEDELDEVSALETLREASSRCDIGQDTSLMGRRVTLASRFDETEEDDEAERDDTNEDGTERQRRTTSASTALNQARRISESAPRKISSARSVTKDVEAEEEQKEEDRTQQDSSENAARSAETASPDPVLERMDGASSVAVQEDEPQTAPADQLFTGEMPVPVQDEKVRDSEKYAVFFKMLRMGVPMPAVKNKMIQKSVNPAILDLGEEAPMTKVLALEKAYEAELRQAKKPVKKGETLHWEAIPADRLMDRETVFAGSDFELETKTLEHVQDLLELFQRLPVDPEKPAAEGTEKASGSKGLAGRWKKERVDSVLDARRAQAISIAMKKLRISPDQPAKFTWALREMNENVLNAQAIEVLMSCPLWPVNEEELSVLKARQNSGGKLAEPDKLVLFVIDTVPDVVTRINAMAFRWEFETSIMEAVKAAGDVKFAARTVMENNNLKLVVRSAIMFGNAVNAESGVQIKGCTLHSLIKLAATRSIRDKKVTVLDGVAAYCLKCYPDFSPLTDMIPPIMPAKKAELETQIKAVRDMRRGVEAIKKMRQMEAFAADALRRLDIVESEMGVARDFLDEVLGYFGCAKNEMDSNVFFELLFQFIELWGKALANRQKEAKTAAAAIMAAAAAKRAAERAVQKAAEKAEREKQHQEEVEASKGKARFTVTLKSLFRGKALEIGGGKDGSVHRSGADGTPRGQGTPRGMTRVSNLFASRSPDLPVRGLAMRASANDGSSVIEPRRARKSIFFGGAASAKANDLGDQAAAAATAGAGRPRGRKSIFWG